MTGVIARRTATALGLVLGLVGPVLAHESATAAPLSKAEADAAIMAYYPAKARAARVNGVAFLWCGLSDQLRLQDCQLTAEYPKSYGFGETALALSKLSQDNATSTAKPRPLPQQVEFRFSLNPPLITPNTLLPGHFQAPPSYISHPSKDQIAAVYPHRARTHEISGRAVLNCAVKEEKLNDCKVVEEMPAGWDFGAAALSAAAFFRLKPIVTDGDLDPDARVDLPISFLVP